MNSVKIRSIRLSQGLFLASIISLALLAAVNIYFSRVIGTAEERYQRVLRLQKSFVDVLTIESNVLAGIDHYAVLLTACMDLVQEVEAEVDTLSPQLIKERENVFNTLLQTVGENRQFYLDLRSTLPRLIEDVRYIHSYHLENLKNNLHRGQKARQENITPDFQRSAIRSAPELDIINAAVQVQDHLLDVISLFYEMQITAVPEPIGDSFQQRMAQFYTAVNRFEDYSLDAQDGLLVEELLLTGNRFKQAFGKLLQNNDRIEILKKKLSDNHHQIDVMFEVAAQNLKNRKLDQQHKLVMIQNLSIAVLLALACWLVYSGLRLSHAFARTVTEAQKIRADLNYRIPDGSGTYLEFDTLFQTLNLLAETADRQVKSLERMQQDLGRRVQERTAELVHMNTRLKNEIADRVKADDSRKELQNQLIRAKKMEAVGTLAGGVAHDLNNILSGIVTYPELLLLDMEKDSPMYLPLENIRRSGEKAASIVQDLLTLARRGVAPSEVVDFRALVEEYLHSPEFDALKRVNGAIEVTTDLAESTGNVRGSRLHLQKAVMNIITNGMEAMPEGGVLSISSRAVYVDTIVKGYDTVQEGDYVCFTVSDSGVGMTPEVTEQIFEPFFTRKKMGRSGTGLGMAVVYSTVKDLGGYIDIDSTPGQGSTFTVYYPLSREEAPSRAEPATGLAELDGDKRHVLVVDDVEEQRQIASEMLKRLNYTVATASGGEAAVAYIREHPIDLVVLDMIMPQGMDGLETFMAMKAVDPELKVIIASGYSESRRVHRAQSLGAGSYIKKPYSIEVLGKALLQALGKK